jgi:serine protease Do
MQCQAKRLLMPVNDVALLSKGDSAVKVKIKSVSVLFALLLGIAAGFMPVAEAYAQLPDFVPVVDANSPAVVNISTTQKVKTGKRMFPHGQTPNFPEGTPFDDFFRRFFDEQQPQEFDSHSLGSGFIISTDGYILTNYHVIQDADEIVVRLSDRREMEAEVIGSDERSDVALLKVDAKDLPVVTIGDSKKLKVGEWVLAIGSPFDFDHSVTAGIVSAVGRSLPNENYVPFIQTDVAINPGNSGGPLFNMDGEVVGVNSQIYSRTGGFMGLSFSIPIDLAMDVVDQLKQGGRVSRGWLGVLIQDVTRELAESFNMDKPVGALVSQVLPDSPAEKAGFKVGDVIVEFNGRPVSTSSSLPPMVGVTPVDKEVPVKVIRDGKPKKLEVTIAELPADEEIMASTRGGGGDTGKASDQRLKIDVTDLTDQQRKQLDLDDRGVLVEGVETGPAHSAGIREGDVIVMINNQNVTSANQFRELSADLPTGKPIAVLVQRRDGPVFLALKLPSE